MLKSLRQEETETTQTRRQEAKSRGEGERKEKSGGQRKVRVKREIIHQIGQPCLPSIIAGKYRGFRLCSNFAEESKQDESNGSFCQNST